MPKTVKKTKAPKKDIKNVPEDNSQNPTPADENTSIPSEGHSSSNILTSIIVRYINPEIGLTDRTFAQFIHGDDFEKIAKAFAEKYKGTII